MKRFTLYICIAAMLLACASAEGLTVWASRADDCYHWNKACGEPAYERYALSEAAGAEFGLQPCPECKPDVVLESFPLEETPVLETAAPTVQGEIACAERGGTWVFRIPAAMLTGAEFGSGSAPAGADALVSVFGGGLSEALDATLAVPVDEGGLVMSLRVVDGDAYVVTRPKHSYKAKRPFAWVAEKLAVDIFKPGAYTVTGVSEVMTYIPPKHVPDLSKTFSEDYGGIDVDVYAGDGLYVAVFHMDRAPESLTGVMRILSDDIPVTGYVSKKKAIFCCALTGDEMKALNGTAPVFIPAGEAEEEEVEPDDGEDFRPITTLPPDLFSADNN